MNIDLFGNTIREIGKMQDWFIVPPFSILDASSKRWRERKKIWGYAICDIGQSRENKLRVGTSGKKSIKLATEFMSILPSGTTSILDPVLCEIITHWFTAKGHLCFDPFAGSSSFGFVSSFKGRLFKGIDLREDQVKFNRTVINKHGLDAVYYCDSSLNMCSYIKDNSCDFIFTCPPYADLEIYSNDPRDLSNMNYSDFFHVLNIILSNTYSKLKKDRFACIVIGEVRNKKTGEYIGLVPRVIEIMMNAGFKYYNEIILKTPIGNLFMRAGRYMDRNRKVGKQHQNVLVFYKGNIKNIAKNYPKLRI